MTVDETVSTPMNILKLRSSQLYLIHIRKIKMILANGESLDNLSSRIFSGMNPRGK